MYIIWSYLLFILTTSVKGYDLTFNQKISFTHTSPKPEHMCRENQFYCGNGQCIDDYFICNGKIDCPLNRDESRHVCKEYGRELCQNNVIRCSDFCYVSHYRMFCGCKEGFKLKDDQNCEDIDECIEDDEACSQTCINEQGSYRCECFEGFKPDPANLNHCIVSNESIPIFALTTVRDNILKFEQDDKLLYEIPYERDAGFDVIIRDKIIVWGEPSTNSIYKSQFVYNATPVKILSNARANELQVDWNYKNIYWLDYVDNTIEISDLNGIVRKVIFTYKGASTITSLRIDPNEGLIFWTYSTRSDPKIFRITSADMAGEKRFTFVSMKYNNIKPELTLDKFEKRIYMITTDGSEIISNNYNLANERILKCSTPSYTNIVAFFEDSIYLHHNKTIYKILKFIKEPPNVAQSTYSLEISNLIILHPSYQHHRENQCLVKGRRRCSHLCVPTNDRVHIWIGTSFETEFQDIRCICPEGYELKLGGVICVKDDIDRCNIIGVCSQGCKKSTCYCNNRYRIDPLNSNVCIAKNERLLITFSIRDELFQFNPYDDKLEPKSLGFIPEDAENVKIDLKSNIVFYVDSNGLKRGVINESSIIEFSSGNRIIYTVDWIYKRIYYFDYNISKIQVANFNGEFVTNLYNAENFGKISIMSLDVKNGLLFHFAPFLNNLEELDYAIFRSNMDGSEVPKNIINLRFSVSSITIDYDFQRLYWSGGSTFIYYSDYDGKNIGFIRLAYKHWYEGPTTPIINLAVHSDWLYKYTKYPAQITRIDKFHGVNQQVFFPDSRIANESRNIIKNLEIHVESEIINHCDSELGQLCSHLCLPSSNKTILITCVCPIGMKLSSDGYKCLNEEVTSTTELSVTEVFCYNDTFKCGFICIPKSWVCDGTEDCSDGSDEVNCNASEGKCGLDQFVCGLGECIDINLVCNKMNDCGDMSDELNCNYTCDPNQSRCKDGQCIENILVCNKENDCSDGEDEENCQYNTTISCGNNQFTCDTGSSCVDNTRKCDGIIDCLDEKDEWNCPSKDKCHHDEFTCGNGGCIPLQLHCNHIHECEDGSDELSCSYLKNCNNETQYDCGIGGCVNFVDLCNKTLEECPTAENDTRNLCNSTACEISRGECQHKCDYYPLGYKCSCHEGYELKDNHCKNINECEDDLTCSHICIDTKGNYSCLCLPHYQVDPNDRTKCKLIDSHYSLIFNRMHSLHSLDISTQSLKTIDINFDSIDAIDYYRPDDTFYWSDMKEQAIFKVSASGKTVHRFLPELKITSKGIAVDWMEENLYWTDYLNNSIGLADLKGSMWTALITDEIFRPTIITVDPLARVIFWVEIVIKPRITRAAMDGTLREVIVENDLIRPTGLAYDFNKGRIYWIDEALNSISTITYNGDRRRVFAELKHDTYNHPRSMTIFDDWIFWVDHDGNSIHKIDKLTGEEKEMIQINSQFQTPHHLHPMFIMTNHSINQPVIYNLCNTILSKLDVREKKCKNSLCTSVYYRPYARCINATIIGSTTNSTTSNALTIICLTIFFIILTAMTILVYCKYFKKSSVVRVVNNPIYYKIEEDNLTIERSNPSMVEHTETQ